MNRQHVLVDDHLRKALDHIGAAVVIVGGLRDIPMADEALDAAIAQDPAVKDARLDVQRSLRALSDAGPGTAATLALEAAANALAARCAEVGYQVGFALRRSAG